LFVLTRNMNDVEFRQLGLDAIRHRAGLWNPRNVAWIFALAARWGWWPGNCKAVHFCQARVDIFHQRSFCHDPRVGCIVPRDCRSSVCWYLGTISDNSIDGVAGFRVTWQSVRSILNYRSSGGKRWIIQPW
jgi:hypothetical protein